MTTRVKILSDLLGAVAINWASSQLSFYQGLGVWGLWFVVIGYQVVTSEAFIRWAWRERRTHKMLTYGIAAFVGAGIAVGLVKFSESKYSAEPEKSTLQANLEDRIYVHERNGLQWGLDDKPYPITPETVFYRVHGETADITLIVSHQNPGEIIATGSDIWVTINSNGAKLDLGGPYKLWRAVWSDTRKGQQFVAKIDNVILPGKSGWGPNEMIRVKFPPGRFKIEYRVEGQTEKHRPFIKEGHYWIDVAPKESKVKEKRKVLWDLREEGVVLRNEIIRPDQHLEWHNKYENWHTRVISAANDLNPELGAWLKTLDKFMPWDFGTGASPAHKKEQAMLTEVLDRLEKHLRKDLV